MLVLARLRDTLAARFYTCAIFLIYRSMTALDAAGVDKKIRPRAILIFFFLEIIKILCFCSFFHGMNT